METAAYASNTPTSHLSVDDAAWKAHKRFSDRDSFDPDDEDNISSSSGDLLLDQDSKRFKAAMAASCSSTDSCFESPINLNVMLRQKRLFHHELRFQEFHQQCALSPITELSMNLTDTSLNVDVDHGFEDGTTPVKRLRNGLRDGGGLGCIGGGLQKLKQCDEGECVFLFNWNIYNVAN